MATRESEKRAARRRAQKFAAELQQDPRLQTLRNALRRRDKRRRWPGAPLIVADLFCGLEGAQLGGRPPRALLRHNRFIDRDNKRIAIWTSRGFVMDQSTSRLLLREQRISCVSGSSIVHTLRGMASVERTAAGCGGGRFGWGAHRAAAGNGKVGSFSDPVGRARCGACRRSVALHRTSRFRCARHVPYRPNR